MFLKIEGESLTTDTDNNIFKWWEIAMGAVNRFFPSDSGRVIFFHNKDTWDRASIDPQEISDSRVQLIQFEGKTDVAIQKLIQGIYISWNADETLLWRLKKE